MEFNIRQMQLKDIEQVQQVAKTSWNETYKNIIPFQIQENFLKIAYSNEMLQKRLENSLFLVSEIQQEIVGFASFSNISEQGKVELTAIYFAPSYQEKGMGSALLQLGIESLSGVKEILVDVEQENAIGLRFYQAKGFKVVEEYDDVFDGHILKTVRLVLKV